MLEVNPRASRTVPFVSKATGRPLAKIAARCMVGQTLAAQGIAGEIVPPYFSVKEAVFPFIKFRGVDTILGPEMKSTGEVMGVGETFAEAFLKSQLAAGVKLPARGQGVHQRARRRQAARGRAREAPGGARLHARRHARHGGRARAAGVAVTPVNKVHEGQPHIVDMMKNDEIALVVNTVQEKRSAIQDSYQIRREALTDEIGREAPTRSRPTRRSPARAPRRWDVGHARARSVRDPGAAQALALRRTSRAVHPARIAFSGAVT